MKVQYHLSVHHSSIKQRLGILVTGVVQGVGFRPFVYNLALAHNLAGFVLNDSGTVRIEVEGEQVDLSRFMVDLRKKAPPLSRVNALEIVPLEFAGDTIFQIHQSERGEHSAKFVPADAATCLDCLQEVFDPSNRRYRYPFTNCTNCGPRFTIIDKLPYDRSSTTMSKFTMCQLCLDEYLDPANRRFHAQPNACPNCGPSIRFFNAKSPDLRIDIETDEEALAALIQALKKGRIAAVKGLGGFHLVCDANNESSIATLRKRKRRKAKPFALMMLDMDMVRRYCDPTPEEENALCSGSRPIVLMRRSNDRLPLNLAGDSDHLGVMLAYTPLHHILLSDMLGPIVATSANLSEEPIAIDNDEALSRLAGIADCFLDHNREIYSRYDDSVIQVSCSQLNFFRRARGYAPVPIQMPFRAMQKVLALGPHLKNTFAMLHDDQAYVSQHIGDLENLESTEHYLHALSTYKKLFDFEPTLIAYDLHPDYFTSSLAAELSETVEFAPISTQHHHAHIVSCMVEHRLTSPVLGVAFDGIGYGADGTLWGGEFLLCDFANFERLAHFETFLLPGATKAVKEPWRIALGILDELSPAERDLFAPFFAVLEDRIGREPLALVRQQLKLRLNSPRSSSCGRVFDAVSAILGVCLDVEYEGQAAIRLQSQASICSHADINDCMSHSYSFTFAQQNPTAIQFRQVLVGAYSDLQAGISIPDISCKFHSTIAHIISETCLLLRTVSGIQQVCLSGGVFQNDLLRVRSNKILKENGFQPYYPEQLPANDGGVSLGQAVIALAKSNAILFQEII